jgi:hypothetical protein
LGKKGGNLASCLNPEMQQLHSTPIDRPIIERKLGWIGGDWDIRLFNPSKLV